MLSLSLTAEGFFGFRTGGSRANEFGVWGHGRAGTQTNCQSGRQGRKKETGTFIRIEMVMNVQHSRRQCKGMMTGRIAIPCAAGDAIFGYTRAQAIAPTARVST